MRPSVEGRPNYRFAPSRGYPSDSTLQVRDLQLQATQMEVGRGKEPVPGTVAFRKWVQAALNQVMGSALQVDGIFGPKTLGVVRRFQERERLKVDGLVGPQTLVALRAALGKPPLPVGSPLCAGLGTPSEDIVGFRFGDHRLRPGHNAQIEKVARCIHATQSSANPIRSVRVVGHTDPVGTEVDNFKLGLRRAETVAKALAAALNRLSPGLAATVSLFPDSRGETELLPGPRERSRRVQIFVPLGPPPPRCVISEPAREDPAGLQKAPVGSLDFNAGLKTLLGRSMRVQGSVMFPADPANAKRFNPLVKGPVPIVVMAHGNHSVFRDPKNRNTESCFDPGGFVPIPNHRGYSYFQRLLAGMGIIAVSIDSNQTNCQGLSTTNIGLRAELILAALDHFESLHKGGHPVFGGRVDLTRVGLLGHSRGGEAVVVAPEALARRIPSSSMSIKAVLSLAPTEVGASSGKPKGYPFMTILPAGDGDVVTNDGARLYDQATPSPFKCQLYVHEANHNFFNSEWPLDDSQGPPAMPRTDHERLLSVYGAAFFRTTLLGERFEDVLSGKQIPPAVRSDNVLISFEQLNALTVDDHENPDISVNSLGQPTAQSSGLTAAEFALTQGSAKTFNGTFFGNTTGMVSQASTKTGLFRSQLAAPTDCTGKEIWIRAAEVYNGSSVPAGPTGFKVGLEDRAGNVGLLDSNRVGPLPRPYDRRADDLATFGGDFTKTMLNTVRFPGACFSEAQPLLNLGEITAIRILQDRGDGRALSFDQLQIV